MFDRICADNGIRHILTAPYSPPLTGQYLVGMGRFEKGVSYRLCK